MRQVSTESGAEKKSIYLPEPATLRKTEQLTQMETLFEFTLDSGRDLGHMPGQFAEISIPGIGEAPISISSSPTHKGSFQMGVRRVGNVTKQLHSLKPGEKIGVRGPFGTHFPVDGAMKGKHVLFIGGGIGLVPLRSAINYVMDNRKDYNDVTILFGCKSPAERLFTKELALWAGRKDVNFKETVDKGDEKWKGNVGVITTLLQRPVIDPRSTVQVSMDLSKLVSVDDPRNTVAVICGPPVMYKFVILELKRLEVPPENTFVSLERRMKCGVGKCGHCQINGLYVCQEGPVFNFADLMNVQEAIR